MVITSGRSGPTYRVTSPPNISTVDLTFTQQDRNTANTLVESFRRTSPTGEIDRLVIDDRAYAGLRFDYVRAATLFAASSRPRLEAACVFGVPTRLTDRLPAQIVQWGTSTFITNHVMQQAATPTFTDLEASKVTMQADPATGEVTVAVDLIGRLRRSDGTYAEERLGTLRGSDKLDGNTASFDGVISGGRISGRFGG